MTEFPEYSDYDAVGLAELVRARHVTPRELLHAAIEAVEKVDPRINAVVTRMFDEASETVSAGVPTGALAGLPFLLKDLHASYAGVATTMGSRFFVDHVPDRDSELVRRYKAGGLVIFGKTNVPELGLCVSTEPRLFGATRNPWDETRIAGGSSGGAAAAVAAGIVPAAHASDGAGSIRIPASCCGLFGLKPSRGRVPGGESDRQGWGGLSVEHVISRTVRDSAALLDLACAPYDSGPHVPPPPRRLFLDEIGRRPEPLRVAVCVRAPWDWPVSADCVRAVDETVELLAALGHEVEPTASVADLETFFPAFAAVSSAHLALRVQRYSAAKGRGPESDDLEPISRKLFKAGRDLPATTYVDALETFQRLSLQVQDFFTDFDVLLAPTLAEPPPPLGSFEAKGGVEAYGLANFRFSPFTPLYNATSHPAMSVPLHWTAEGLPVGVQIVGRFGHEATLLRLASQLEKARPWKHRRPAINARSPLPPHRTELEAAATTHGRVARG